MPEKQGKYPCQYCNKPCRNPQSKKAHERACPKNPNRRIAKTGGDEGTQVEFNAETSPKLETEKEIPKEPELSEKQKKDIAETDAVLSNLPSMRDLRGIVSRTAQDVDQHGREIAGINAKLGTIAGAIDAMASRRAETPGPESKETLPKKGIDIQKSLDASLKADKKERGSASAATSGSKMDDLRKETKEKPNKEEPRKTESGGDPAEALAAMRGMGDMPEWMQKVMAFGAVSQQFLPLLNALKGQPMETPQTPDDMKALDRTFANMSSLFTLALKMTDNVTREARKRVIDELKDTYSFVPKPGTGIVEQPETKQESEKSPDTTEERKEPLE